MAQIYEHRFVVLCLVLFMMTSSNGNISALLAICAGNSPHKGQGRGALMFSLICTRMNGWVNNDVAGDLRRHRAHYDVTVMYTTISQWSACLMCPYSPGLRNTTFSPRQNGGHFKDDILKLNFFYEDCWIVVHISLKYMPRGQMNSNPELVQIMAQCRTGDKP